MVLATPFIAALFIADWLAGLFIALHSVFSPLEMAGVGRSEVIVL